MVKLNSQVRKACQKSSRGLTLIEVLIAMALIGIIGVAILSALSQASMILIIADRRATAESLARTQMEDVKSQPYRVAPPGGVATYPKITGIPVGFSIWSLSRNRTIVSNITGIPWYSRNNTAVHSDVGLQKITVIVKYDIVRGDNRMVQQRYTLEGYKRKP